MQTHPMIHDSRSSLLKRGARECRHLLQTVLRIEERDGPLLALRTHAIPTVRREIVDRDHGGGRTTLPLNLQPFEIPSPAHPPPILPPRHAIPSAPLPPP